MLRWPGHIQVKRLTHCLDFNYFLGQFLTRTTIPRCAFLRQMCLMLLRLAMSGIFLATYEKKGGGGWNAHE